ncbi:hypothetical protein AGMMS50239_26090 [Bacteroidia bacterium]|nr:hypothetical protein AGMMS50239_26090 [Bacteroidia bacterium]
MVGIKDSIKNVFAGGMNLDSDIAYLKQGEYLEAENISISINEQGSSGAIQAIVGNKQMTLTGDPFVGSIIGVTSIGDYIVVITEDLIANKDYIYRLEEVSTDTFKVSNICTWTEFPIGRKSWNSPDLNRISFVSNKENVEVQNIYFADGINPMCIIDVLGLNEELRHILKLPKFDFKVESVFAGNLDDGAYSFAYQIYKKNGAQSNIVSINDIVSINKKSQKDGAIRVSLRDTATPYANYNIRIFALYRKERISDPEVSIIYDGPKDEIVIGFNDRSTVPSLEWAEYQAINSRLVIPSCICSINGYLAAATPTYINFMDGIEYDARAFGWTQDNYISLVNIEDLSEELQVTSVANLPDDDKRWISKSCIDTKTETFNLATKYDNSYASMYYPLSNTFGGTGKNIEYRVVTTALAEDYEGGKIDFWRDGIGRMYSGLDTTNIDKESEYVNSGIGCTYGVSIPMGGADGGKNVNVVSNAGKINVATDQVRASLNYSNSLLSSKIRGFQHDSIYHMAIVFSDEFGAKSNPFEIGYVRFPSALFDQYRLFDSHARLSVDGNEIGEYAILSYPLGIEVNVLNFPAGAMYAELLIEERDISLRNVIASGISSVLYAGDASIGDGYRLPIHPTVSDELNYIGGIEMNTYLQSGSVNWGIRVARANKGVDSPNILFSPEFDYGRIAVSNKEISIQTLFCLHPILADDSKKEFQYACGINVDGGYTSLSPYIDCIDEYGENYWRKRLRGVKSNSLVFDAVLPGQINERPPKNVFVKGMQLGLVFKEFNIFNEFPGAAQRSGSNFIFDISEGYNVKNTYKPGDDYVLSKYTFRASKQEPPISSYGSESEGVSVPIGYMLVDGVSSKILNSSGSRDFYKSKLVDDPLVSKENIDKTYEDGPIFFDFVEIFGGDTTGYPDLIRPSDNDEMYSIIEANKVPAGIPDFLYYPPDFVNGRYVISTANSASGYRAPGKFLMKRLGGLFLDGGEPDHNNVSPNDRQQITCSAIFGFHRGYFESRYNNGKRRFETCNLDSGGSVIISPSGGQTDSYRARPLRYNNYRPEWVPSSHNVESSDLGFDPKGPGGSGFVFYGKDADGISMCNRFKSIQRAGKLEGYNGLLYTSYKFNNGLSLPSAVLSHHVTFGMDYGASGAIGEVSMVACSIKAQLEIKSKYTQSEYEYISRGTLKQGKNILFCGDVFPCVNSHIYTHYAYTSKTSPNSTDPCASSMYLYYPCESSINPYYADDTMAVSGKVALEYQSEPYVSPRTGVKYEYPAYSYNTVYSGIFGDRYISGEDVKDIYFDNRIIYAGRKINNEFIDSWCSFKPLDFLDTDGGLGSINGLSSIRNVLYAICENGVFRIGVGEKALANQDSDNDNSQILLGSGDAFQDSMKISDSHGTHRNDACGLLNVSNYIVWFDRDKRSIIRLAGDQINSISITEAIQSYLNKALIASPIKFIYDYRNRGFIFDGNLRSIIHNDSIDKFVSLLHRNINAERVSTNNGMYSVLYDSTGNTLWREFDGNLCSFFGEDKEAVIRLSTQDSGSSLVYDYTVIPNIGLSDQESATIIKRTKAQESAPLYNDIFLDNNRHLRENIFYVPVGRENSLNRRLIGRNLLYELRILPDSTKNFSIPYIETMCRKSNI